MTSIKEDLIAARAKVEKGWCQGVAARTSKGVSVSFADPAAARSCILGALYATTKDPVGVQTCLYTALRNRGISDLSLSAYNDIKGRTKKSVLALFDEAIRCVEEEGT